MTLPLYPQLKLKIEKLLDTQARAAARGQLGMFAPIPRSKQHEGNRLQYTTIDGAVKAAEYQRAAAACTIELADIPTMSLDDAVALARKRGEELGVQQAKFNFESFNQAVEEVGNSVQMNGQPLTVEAALQLFEKMQLPFDAAGRPLMPTWHTGPDLEASVADVLRQLNEDPAAQARLQEIVDRKREEWNAEQDRRKLVA
ncbi:hypothetical protein KDK95_09975 [Actinospica sp. MGRD01-02]|uniref:Uncharacterized protein n=1 Tax=Actinospica acidithermotolerans TaxID=2828514 RepID=A0A941IIC1_9ACTN|nr:hypothetical protein [Actinospica acidithermotolerans]MBR7826632.1 hypothetical protein [Actinospica acidithermotolerans]